MSVVLVNEVSPDIFTLIDLLGDTEEAHSRQLHVTSGSNVKPIPHMLECGTSTSTSTR